MAKKETKDEELCQIVEIFGERFKSAKGIFGIEDEADEKAKLVKLQYIKTKVEALDRG